MEKIQDRIGLDVEEVLLNCGVGDGVWGELLQVVDASTASLSWGTPTKKLAEQRTVGCQSLRAAVT
jgi:hypothetical protein